MIIFIDESGDPGFKIEKGASPFFVIGLVVFKNDQDCLNSIQKIDFHKRKFKLGNNYEFKFNKTRKKAKVQYFKVIKYLKFSVRVLVVDKKILEFSERIRIKRNNYKYFLKLLLKRNVLCTNIVKLRIDGSAKKLFKESLKIYIKNLLKAEKEDKLKIDFKIVNSKSDLLIQLADMIVGAIARSYLTDKGDAKIYKELIKDKIELEWILKKSDLASILK